MRACILSIGTEIMLGEITDTNAAWLARDLTQLGIPLTMVTQVGDDHGVLRGALTRSLEIADLVICTGGIGPTDDDLTRETIADLVQETPEVDPALLATLEAYFANLGREMPARNRKQAWLIPSATSLPNPVGTAPGWMVAHGNKRIVTMPGVPREMYRMWTEQARPRVLSWAQTSIIDNVSLWTVGIGESAAEELLHDLVLAGDPQVATYAKDTGVQIRVTAIGDDPAETRARRDRARAEVYRRLGQFIWGEDDDTLPAVIARRLRARGLRLIIREYGTGGALAAMFTADPESAERFLNDHIYPAGAPVTLPSLHDHECCVLLCFAGTIDNEKIARGSVSFRVIGSAGPELDETWPVRGSLPDIQRRAALNAMFALLRWTADR